MGSQQLLFLCTGNYYRSRVAEAIFNHLAVLDQISWRAVSRGFRPKPESCGLAPEARDYLCHLRIPLTQTASIPKKLTGDDLTRSSLVIALYETEHRPMVQQQFPLWENHMIYWQIPDIDVISSEQALPDLEDNVREFFELIKDGCALGCAEHGATEF